MPCGQSRVLGRRRHLRPACRESKVLAGQRLIRFGHQLDLAS
jgi:hypothetical protein